MITFSESEYLEKERKIMLMDGWLSPASVAVMDTFLSYQQENDCTGHILEIGVWEGKSASVLANKLQKPEKIYLVDPLLSEKESIVRKNIFSISENAQDSVFLFLTHLIVSEIIVFHKIWEVNLDSSILMVFTLPKG